MATIHDGYDSISPRPNVILQLHRDLYSFSGSSIGGNYKNRTPLAAAKLRTAERNPLDLGSKLKRGEGYESAACWNERGNPPLKEIMDKLPRYKNFDNLIEEVDSNGNHSVRLSLFPHF